jgi:GNAT superfamily N-acetyltransferase
MNVEIRKCTPGDIGAIISLMRGFAEFENLGNYFETTEERLASAMFGEKGFVEGLVAAEGDRVFAYALFYPYFASFRGQLGYYLEDIYISDDYRGKGIGEAMLRAIAALAKSRGFERLDFQVLEWNAPAVRFYEKFGVVRDDDERHYKFIDEAFHRLAS